jgi:hypothetical protein
VSGPTAGQALFKVWHKTYFKNVQQFKFW